MYSFLLFTVVFLYVSGVAWLLFSQRHFLPWRHLQMWLDKQETSLHVTESAISKPIQEENFKFVFQTNRSVIAWGRLRIHRKKLRIGKIENWNDFLLKYWHKHKYLVDIWFVNVCSYSHLLRFFSVSTKNDEMFLANGHSPTHDYDYISVHNLQLGSAHGK
jgi:hypothetical protein